MFQPVRVTGDFEMEIVPDPNLKEKVKRELSLRLRRAAVSLRDRMRQRVGRPFPPASVPGEPPRRRTGRGQGAIIVRTDGTVIRVEVDPSGEHMVFLEKFMARPWFFSTVIKHYPRIEEILRKG